MKRNTLTTAVLAGLTGMAGMVSVSNAVNVNPDGLGQVLLYPYYTAHGDNDTLISIVNTTDEGKAVKIRFIEALNSREVLDFNIYMSAYDVWAAAITRDESTGGGMIRFNDTTCTAPYLLETKGGEQEFLRGAYIGAADDGGPQGHDRTLSGYVEVIEMGVLTGAAANAAEHVNGVPPNSGVEEKPCSLFTERWITSSAANGTGEWGPPGNPGFESANYEIDPPSGGLFGSGAVLNVENGTMFSYNATAIDGFWAEQGEHTDPENLFPSLGSGTRFDSTVFVNGDISDTNWAPADNIHALNHVLSYETLMNEYAIENAIGGSSEWVVTFPTKRFHTDAAPQGPIEGDTEAVPPFTSVWTADSPIACEELNLSVWDREEQTPDVEGGIGVSPSTTIEDVFELCREANVIRFSNDESLPDSSEIFGEPSSDVTDLAGYGYVNFNLPSDFQHGWARFDFGNFRSVSSMEGLQVVGLPVIGFWANTYTAGGVAEGTLANYGGAFAHRGSRTDLVSADD
ncbi:hypothetical protein IC757_02520 [Wenzhouxiangella sp. AB-CW3]|uniref:hypothetical protein n=1 Tax=Wenzhouxiangella sp. AB-CW3 TaxID=2771012 RepID=UPI00168BE7A8|nr:hypothetical protein [Wenzhouxiangella sp. AB-CW3]QOC23052.1 hypothetical protein IC757_02520 [Wenzhouxiangella sp. AB-CW3]